MTDKEENKKNEIDLYNPYESGETFDDEIIPSPPSPLSRRPRIVGTVPAVLFLYVALMLSYLSWNGIVPDVFSLSRNSIVNDHQYWRILTSLFVHADVRHFASNLLLLSVFGWFLFEYFGVFVFPVAALLCGMGANLTAVCLYGGNIKLIGASGMVYAMAALWLVLYIRFDTERRIAVRIFRALAFSLAMLFPTSFSPEVSYAAHAAGFVYGIAGGLFMGKFVRIRD